MGRFLKPEQETQTKAYLFRMTATESQALHDLAAQHTQGHIGNVIRLALDQLAEKRPAKKAAKRPAKKRKRAKAKS